jgi:predicted nucleotide-binding protein
MVESSTHQNIMASRRPPSPSPSSPLENADEFRKGAARLERLIKDLAAFDVEQVTERWSNQQKAMEARIDGDLAAIFGHGTPDYNRYAGATVLDNANLSFLYDDAGPSVAEIRSIVRNGIDNATGLLRSAVQWLSDEATDRETTSGSAAPAGAPLRKQPPKPSQKVFIVHGHDEAALQTVARFIEKIRLEAIILREQANQGRTIIEKIEANADVGFAVVLLTPDDVGAKAGMPTQPRARQNVLLELGYFIGSLGRPRVCALAAPGNMELPTDFAGVVWEALDPAGAWKQSLARELKAAGFAVDWNDVMG